MRPPSNDDHQITMVNNPHVYMQLRYSPVYAGRGRLLIYTPPLIHKLISYMVTLEWNTTYLSYNYFSVNSELFSPSPIVQAVGTNSVRIVSVGLNVTKSFSDTSGSAAYLGTDLLTRLMLPLGKLKCRCGVPRMPRQRGCLEYVVNEEMQFNHLYGTFRLVRFWLAKRRARECTPTWIKRKFSILPT